MTHKIEKVRGRSQVNSLARWLLVLAIGCGDGDVPRHGHLLDGGAEPANVDASAEEERVRRLQLLRVIGPDGQPQELTIASEFWTDAGNSLRSSNFGLILFQQCFHYTEFKALPNNERVQRLKCLGDTLLSMATEPGTISLTLNSEYKADDNDETKTTPLAPGVYRILPQNSPTNAKLAEAAAKWYGATIRRITDLFRDQGIDIAGPGIRLPHASQELGSIFVDSYYSGKEAYEVALKNTLAAAHESTGGVAPFRLKRRRAVASSQLSMMKGAHLMFGGSPGFRGDTTKGFCTSGRLSGPAEAALKVFRDAGVSPDDVRNPAITTEELVNALPSAASPPSKSVRARLGDAWGQTATVPDVFKLYSLTVEDFDAARRQLVDEIDIWARSLKATLPLGDAVNGVAPQYKHYAAVAVPPQPRDPWYWAALAQSGSLPETDWFVDPLERGDPTNYAAFIDRTYGYAQEMLGALEHSPSETIPPETKAIEDEFRMPLLHLTSQGDRQGTLRQCNSTRKMGMGDEVPSRAYKIMVKEASLDEGARWAVGEDAMACATTGAVDGAPCVLETGELSEFDSVTGHLASVTLPSDFDTKERLYVLRPKLIGNTTAGPGGWTVVVATHVFNGPSNKCRDMPIVPEAAERVAKAIAPSPEWCGRTLYNCAGGHFDERIPLEDELTDDQDGIESSWKHYLALAKDAAAESDRLGEDYINSSIAVDQRDEELNLRQLQQREKAAAELETLQDVCGTAVDIDPLLDALGKNAAGDVDLQNLGGGPCTGQEQQQPGMVCRDDGTAVLDWQELARDLPAMQPLANCISDFADRMVTTLGDKDICAWKDTNHVICGSSGISSTNGYACPDINRSQSAGAAGCKAPAGATKILTAKAENALGLFSTADTLTAAPDVSLCDSIRSLRAHPANTADAQTTLLQEIVNSNQFDPLRLAELRKRIQFEATLGGYFNLNVDGKTVFSSGNVQTGPSNAWPCAASKKNCDDRSGLFCWSETCAQANGLANQDILKKTALKVFNAVAAAQLSTYSGPYDPPISIWRPLYLMHGAVPLGNTMQTVTWNYTSSLTNANEAFNVYSNDNWKYVISNYPHSVFEGFGSVWNLKSDNDRFFAIGRMDPMNPPALRAEYWGGLSTAYTEGTGLNAPRYFNQMLSVGTARNPGRGHKVHYGEDIWVNVDGDGDEHHDRVLHALKGWNLETGNWSDHIAQYADVRPIEFDYKDESLLDGLELLCEVSEEFGERSVSCDAPPDVTQLSDLSKAGSYLECMGNRMNNAIALAVLTDFPRAALDKSGLAPRRGQMGTALSDLRGALLRLSASGPTMARTIRDFGLDMKRLRETIHLYDLEDKIQDVQFDANRIQQAAGCVTRITDSFSSAVATSASNAGAGGAVAILGTIGSIATCTNSFAQVEFADTLRDLKKEQNSSQRELATIDFSERFSAHIEAMEKQSIELSSAQEDIQKQLGIIEGLHAKARRSVGKAIWYLSQQATNQVDISAALAGRSKTSQLRYERAFDNAKRLAFLAGRAIEQRLGVNLTDMSEDLPLVEAPANWAPSICTTTGIDYTRLRNPNGGSQGGSGGTSPGGGYTYEDAYIGDYIRKLENVVESYRLTQNFHEGSDTAVVSLRDDVFGLRKDCAVESPNLLYWASALDRLQVDTNDAERLGWVVRGCAAGTNLLAAPNCLTVRQHLDTPFVDLRPQLRSVPGFSVDWGTITGARLVQTVSLQPGTYRFSWYTKDGKESAAATSGFIRLNTTDVMPSKRGAVDASQSAPWVRPWFIFDVAEAGQYEVGFRKPAMSNSTSVTIAAPMLEQVQADAGATSSDNPKMFSNTTDQRTSVLAVCQDTDGSVFRKKEWTRGCTYLCPDGYASDCSNRAKEACYWETSLHVSQREIEAGHQFKVSGFARGNFNYRIDSLGLNFVGTALRACDGSETPNACYSGGFIPYSLTHAGPYFVRNRQGLDYDAKLFVGNVEHGRGLATERYLANPLSDTDRSLVEGFLRHELQGRPLDGDFTLRVWDEDGVDFSKIEDVQLLLKYRYWTRFN